MTKQEKIQEAYGDYWELFYDELQERALNDDGFIDHVDFQDYTDFVDFDYEEEYINEYYSRDKFRPITLKGIENNNGWIKIESEDDLPKDESLNYHALNIEFPEQIEICLRVEVNKRFTHYQPIKKPQPPIY